MIAPYQPSHNQTLQHVLWCAWPKEIAWYIRFDFAQVFLFYTAVWGNSHGCSSFQRLDIPLFAPSHKAWEETRGSG